MTPETKYYFRALAKNAAGEGSKVEEVETGPRHPVLASAVEVSESLASSARVSAMVIPENYETHWRFEYSTDRKALEEGHGIAGPEGVIAKAEADENYHVVTGELVGLAQDTTYYVRFSARNEFGEVVTAASGFPTAGPPLVDTFAAHTFNGETVRVLGSVESRGYDTHYEVEYTTEAQFQAAGWGGASKTVAVDGGSGAFDNGVFPVSLVGIDLPDLEAGVTYRYRVVASSAAPGSPVVMGAEQALRAPVAGRDEGGLEEAQPSPCPNESVRLGASAALPDCRAYEQLTPSEKAGAQDVYKYGVIGEAAFIGEDGEHLMLHAPGVEWGPNGDAKIPTYLFTRTSAGWQMTSVRPQDPSAGYSYLPFLFSADLSEVALVSDWETSGVSRSENIELESGPVGGPYQTVASIPRGQEDDERVWIAASTDGRKLVLQTQDHRLLGSPTSTTSGNDLYEYSAGDGELHQVNVGVGMCGARMVKGYEGYEGNVQNLSSPHAVSADGSRVFFEAVPGTDCAAASHLYLRLDGTRTVDIGEYAFLAANAEGTKLLLEKQNGAAHEFVLYETGEPPRTKLLFSTKEALNVGLTPVVSSDFGAMYFFSAEQLTPEAPAPTSSEKHDLYRYDLNGGALRFIAQDNGNSGADFTGHSTSEDGRYFYWISTDIPGVPGGSTNPSSDQVYRFDNVENIVECMSCASAFDPHPNLSATFSGAEEGNTYPNDGVPLGADASANGDYVFFDTPAALVPADVNGEVRPEGTNGENPGTTYSVSSDVYEWRKDGVDGCAHVQGCVALISSGTGGYRNVLLGTAASGRDVFFATHDALVASDDDTAGDVYDARIGGGFAPPPPGPVECEGGACQSPVGAPIDTTPASLSFSGPGNVLAPTLGAKAKAKPRPKLGACGRRRVRRRGRCVKSKARAGRSAGHHGRGRK